MIHAHFIGLCFGKDWSICNYFLSFLSWTFLLGALTSVVQKTSFDDFLEKAYTEGKIPDSNVQESVDQVS